MSDEQYSEDQVLEETQEKVERETPKPWPTELLRKSSTR